MIRCRTTVPQPQLSEHSAQMQEIVALQKRRVGPGTGVKSRSFFILKTKTFSPHWISGAKFRQPRQEQRNRGSAGKANLAVRGLNGIVLRVNYVVFHFPSKNRTHYCGRASLLANCTSPILWTAVDL